jgi:CHASE2 domain-containing sensor protein
VLMSEQRAGFDVYDIKGLVFINVVESVYSAVRTDSLYKGDYVSFLLRINWAFFGGLLCWRCVSYFHIDIFWDNILFRHFLLRYILAQHFSSFDLRFLYRLTVRA